MDKSQLILGDERKLDQAKFSICIPAYRRIDTLKKAIDSILSQDKDDMDFCLIISEDDSDEHEQILNLISGYHDAKIVYYYNKPALGMAEKWNQCFRLAHSEYVALLHDDDYLYPNYVNTVKQLFDQRIEFDVVYFDHDLLRFDEILSERDLGLRGI